MRRDEEVDQQRKRSSMVGDEESISRTFGPCGATHVPEGGRVRNRTFCMVSKLQSPALKISRTSTGSLRYVVTLAKDKFTMCESTDGPLLGSIHVPTAEAIQEHTITSAFLLPHLPGCPSCVIAPANELSLVPRPCRRRHPPFSPRMAEGCRTRMRRLCPRS